ncbi:MAG TPA: DUF1990 family protein [Candidatus Dormibacteraeota bacterium]
MRLLFRRRPPARSALRWHGAAATSSIDRSERRHDLYTGAVARLPQEDSLALFERLRDRLFRYDIFPSRLLSFALDPAPPLGSGTVIVQAVGVGRVRLEFAVKVIDSWDRSDASDRDAGFTYVTLRGHPERGRETFRAFIRSDGEVVFSMEAWSEPGTRLTALMGPVARFIQVHASRAAVRRVTGAQALDG